MKRILTFVGIVGAVLAFNVGTGSAFAATCGNSFPNDGYAGPRWVQSASGVQGNVVHINCPSGSTHWDINYVIQYSGDGGNHWVNWWSRERMGNGSPSDFAYLVGTTCDGGLHIWRTHVDNLITGGNVNKPTGGNGVYLAC